MIRACKVMALHLWVGLVVLVFFVPVLFQKVINGAPESSTINQIREAAADSFLHGIWPLWNPLLGPGGSPAQTFAFIPWNHLMLVSRFVSNWNYLVVFDVLLMALAYVTSVRLFKIRTRASWLLVPIAFLFLYTMDMVQEQAVLLVYNPVFIVILPLLALIYRIELKAEVQTKKPFLLIALLYALAFHGARIELWGFQFPIVLALWIGGLRIFHGRPRIHFPRDVAYLTALIFGWLANAWQINWVVGLISESGRTRAQTSPDSMNLLLGFTQTFFSSSLQWILIVYFCTTGALFAAFGSKRKIFLLILPPLILLTWQRFPVEWLREDIWVPPSFSGLLGLLFLGGVGALYLQIFLNACSGKSTARRRLFFDLPVLTLCLLQFLFENENSFNWGATSLSRYDTLLISVFIAGLLASLYSSRKVLRGGVLFVLLGIYFLRCHVSWIFLRLFGILWHNQRDSIFISGLLSILFLLGLEKLLSLVVVRRFHWNAFSFGLLLGLGVTLVSSFQSAAFWAVGAPWIPKSAATQCHRKVEEALKEHSLTGPAHRIAAPFWALRPGALMASQVQQINTYDSLVQKEIKQTLSSPRLLVPVRSECQLPFPWYPNNLIRVLGCQKSERAWNYEGSIVPRFDTSDSNELRRLGANLVLASNLPEYNWKRVDSIKECGNAGNLYQIRDSFRDKKAEALALFHSGISGCTDFDIQKADPMEVRTDLYSNPTLKSAANFEFPDREGGCLLLRIAHSRFWTFSSTGTSLRTEPGESTFTKLYLKRGQTRISASYFEELPVLWKIGMFLQLVLAGLLLPLPALHAKHLRFFPESQQG